MTDRPKFSALLVDDEPTGLKILSKYLAKLGFNCTMSLDTDEAQKLVNEQSFDLIITDLVMPKMTGFELIRYILSTEKNKNAKISALSGNLSEDKIAKLVTLGIIRNFKKPVNHQAFSEYIKAKFYGENTLAFDSKFSSILRTVLEEASEDFFDVPQDVSDPFMFKDIPVDNGIAATVQMISQPGKAELTFYFEELFVTKLSKKVNFKDIHLDSAAKNSLVEEYTKVICKGLKNYLDNLNVHLATSKPAFFVLKDRTLVTKEHHAGIRCGLHESSAKFVVSFHLDEEFSGNLKRIHDSDLLAKLADRNFF